MGKAKDRNNSNTTTTTTNKMLVGVVWSCADAKLLLTSLFFLCSLATILQFLPTYSSTVDLRSCLSSSSSSSSSSTTTNITFLPTAAIPTSDSTTSYHPAAKEQVVSPSITKRAFNPVGAAAYLFIQMGSYRGGPNTFAVIGLGSKPLHVYAKPQFQCHWIPHSNNNSSSSSSSGNLTVPGHKILPDWGYGRVYTVVVVNCTFPVPVGANGSGGRLVLHTSTGSSDVGQTERVEALVEAPESVYFGVFTDPPRYDYLYCGSSLYGNLSPQRLREWLAYHVNLFGPRSHFVIHDAGGVHEGVMDVLRPWMEKGYVTLEDIREQERFDGYYHNQFLVVNDCLHRYRFAAKWIFFFDVDEFIYVSPKTGMHALLEELEHVTQFTINQMPMSSKLCLTGDVGRTPRMWGIEKLVYRDVKRRVRLDRKYAIQPRNAFATGVHMSQNVAGKTLHRTDWRIKYFHYHGTIADRRDPCREFVDGTNLTHEGTPYVLDTTLRLLAGNVKKFELKAIGARLKGTRQ